MGGDFLLDKLNQRFCRDWSCGIWRSDYVSLGHFGAV